MEQTTVELDGYGYGYGDGSGSGSGYGYGDGYGYGYGYGDGYGYGYGYSYGYGYGDKACAIYLAALLAAYIRNPENVVAFWRSKQDGTPANGGSGAPASVGNIQEITGPLKICTKCALHGTTLPAKWEGDRWWIVELHAPVQRDGDKVGSLKRTIVADLGKCPF